MKPPTQLEKSESDLKQVLLDIAELQEYQLFINNVQEYAIFFLDAKGIVTRWGPGAENIYRYKEEEVVGKYFDFLYTDEDAAQGRPQHNLKEANKGTVYEELRTRLRKGKVPFSANVMIIPLHAETDGTLLGYAKIVKDVSEQQILKDQLKQSYQYLDETNKALNQSNIDLELFATIAAHDLQTPIRKVASFCEMVLTDPQNQLGENSLDYLQRIRSSAQSMEMLVSDLLKLATVSQGEMPLQRISLPDLLSKVLNSFNLQITEKKAQIHLGHLDSLYANEIQLTQLFHNLITNALKFQQKGRQPIINISSKIIHDQYCEIQVQDNGIGFKQEQAGQIFDTFKRLVGKSSYPGSGVGLSICKRIVERHCGSITAKSKPGEGATFIITLPLHGHDKDPVKNCLLQDVSMTPHNPLS